MQDARRPSCMGTMRYCDFGASGAAGAWFRCSSAFFRVSSKPPEVGGATGAAPPAGWLCEAGAGPTIEAGARLKLASQDNSRLVAKKQTARMAVVRRQQIGGAAARHETGAAAHAEAAAFGLLQQHRRRSARRRS